MNEASRWVKICGIRSVEQAELVAECGPDAIGLNFWDGSKRHVDVDTAEQIVAALPANVTPVGLFINQPVDEVAEIIRRLNLRLVQLHGDETPADHGRLLDAFGGHLPDGFQFLRVLRMGTESTPDFAADRQECDRHGLPVRAVLVDAAASGQYGGSGHRVPWERLADAYPQSDALPLILAGGLTPQNVAEAVQTVRPWGVDTASGVESGPGVKDADKVQVFVDAARRT